MQQRCYTRRWNMRPPINGGALQMQRTVNINRLLSVTFSLRFTNTYQFAPIKEKDLTDPPSHFHKQKSYTKIKIYFHAQNIWSFFSLILWNLWSLTCELFHKFITALIHNIVQTSIKVIALIFLSYDYPLLMSFIGIAYIARTGQIITELSQFKTKINFKQNFTIV